MEKPTSAIRILKKSENGRTAETSADEPAEPPLLSPELFQAIRFMARRRGLFAVKKYCC